MGSRPLFQSLLLRDIAHDHSKPSSFIDENREPKGPRIMIQWLCIQKPMYIFLYYLRLGIINSHSVPNVVPVRQVFYPEYVHISSPRVLHNLRLDAKMGKLDGR